MPNDRISEEELLSIMKKLHIDALAHEDKPAARPNVPVNAKDGHARIENNRILVADPQDDGRYPFIQAVYPVILKNLNIKLAPVRS